MLKRESANSIAAMLKVSPEEFWEKLSSEGEQDFQVPTLNVFTEEELNLRIQNEKANAYADGKTAGEEMSVKDAKRKYGYEFEGKSFDKFLEHHDKSLKETYSKDSSARVKELESDIQGLNQAHASALQVLKTENEQYKTAVERQKVTNQLLTMMPKETTISKDHVLTLFTTSHEVGQSEDGKAVVKRNGEVLKNPTTAAPLELKEVFDTFITENGFSKNPAGRGDGDRSGNKGGSSAKSITQFQQEWTSNGGSINSMEYDKAYAEWRKENPSVEV